MATFPERLRKLRMEAGYKTQEDLAKRLGVAKNTVSVWERGERPPKDEMIIQLVEILDVPLPYLFGVSDERDYPVMTDEEAAAAADADEQEIRSHMLELYDDLSYETQEIARGLIAVLWRKERNRGNLRSQQDDERA